MKQTDSKALFRLSILGPLVSRKSLERGELCRIIRELAQREYVIPGSRKNYVSEKTISTWYYAWRRDGIKGLESKPRVDRGRCKLARKVQEAILNAKRENPQRSISKILELIETNERVARGILTKSTIHRLLQAHNLSRKASSPIKNHNILDELFIGRAGKKLSHDNIFAHYHWMLNLLQSQCDAADLKKELGETITSAEIESLLHHICDGPLRQRNRAVTVLAHFEKIPTSHISQFLSVTSKQVSYTLQKFNASGLAGLFGPSKKRPRKYEDAKCKDAVFAVLHSPPKEHGINRTSWTLRSLSSVLRKNGFPIGIGTIAKIIRDAGFRFRKAKKILTSTDPEYTTKLHEITNILKNLKSNESFFSVDEYGPFSVKIQGGTSLVKASQLRVIPQYQKSKGSLIVTAALELSENQITHFYSKRKNTDEMIKLIEILIAKYSSKSRLYLSWDAASWHASKKLYERLDEINSEMYRKANATPLVTLAPLPSCAQFLNVIEGVFSGMARAIIHNSDYQSIAECSAAIDRYIDERNLHFKSFPMRAGNKIWGKERVPSAFSESSNCKDPLYR